MFTFVTAAALALAAGSAQAAGKLGGASGMDRAGDGQTASSSRHSHAGRVGAGGQETRRGVGPGAIAAIASRHRQRQRCTAECWQRESWAALVERTSPWSRPWSCRGRRWFDRQKVNTFAFDPRPREGDAPARRSSYWRPTRSGRSARRRRWPALNTSSDLRRCWSR